jgi:hypothetical protein
VERCFFTFGGKTINSALSLLVLGILADDHDAALAADDLAFFADGFDGRSYFHWIAS